MKNVLLPVYILNLSSNPQSLANCLKEFKGRIEFEVNIVKGEKDKKGEVRLWESIKRAVKKAVLKKEDLCIICKENHCFTEEYNVEKLLQDIFEAHRIDANYLLGSVEEGFSNMLILPSRLCWIDSFQGTQFIVLFNPFYDLILNEQFYESDIVDEKLSNITSNKFIVYPPVSRNKRIEEDKKNAPNGKVSQLIKKRRNTEKRIKNLIEKTNLYKKMP